MSEQSVAFRIWGFFVTQDVRQRIGAWCYRTQCLETCVCATRRVSDETMVIFCSCRPGQKMGINNASRSGKGLFVAWFGKVSGGSGFTSLKRLTSKPQAPFLFSQSIFWPWKLLFLTISSQWRYGVLDGVHIREVFVMKPRAQRHLDDARREETAPRSDQEA
jgi:hypothetical protein